MLSFFKRLAGQVPTPKPDRVTLFVADDGVPAYKDDADVVHSLKGGNGEIGPEGPEGPEGPQGPIGPGVPAGGTTGQVVRKKSATAGDTEWATLGAAAYKAVAAAAAAGQLEDLMPVGFMGFGADSLQIRNNIDSLDNCTLTGIYRSAGGSLNNPTASGAFMCIHMATGGTPNSYAIQLAINDSTARPYTRVKVNNVYSGWIPIAYDNQVVHTTGNENIAGAKTFAAMAVMSGGAQFGVSQALGFTDTAGNRYNGIRGDGDGVTTVAGSLASGTGGVVLRPVGLGSGTGQVRVAPDGTMTWSGNNASLIATRASLGAVGLNGDETIAGIKTFSSYSRWNLSTVGSVEYGTPAAFPGIIIRNGNPSDDAAARRFDIRNAGTSCSLVLNDVAGNNTGGARGLTFEITAIRPSTSNLLSLGSATSLWTTIYANNATISTSDKRLKTGIRQMTPDERSAFLKIARLPGVWQWRERAEIEGADARLHGGPTVQDAIAIMEAHGLDPWAYGCFCYDKWEALEEKWYTWDAKPAEWAEWEAQDAVYETIPAELDDDGNEVSPEYQSLLFPAVEAGRVQTSKAVEAGKELIQAARDAGDRYSFRKEELLCFIAAAQAYQLDEVEQRLAALEARLA